MKPLPFVYRAPKKTLLSLSAFAAAASLALVAQAPVADAAATRADTRPNVVVVMTDDQDFRSMSTLPNVRKLIGDKGTQFTTSVVNTPLCGPSRSTFLTGQYLHNHGVMWNDAPLGGYDQVDNANTLPVWMHRAGYRTIHIGKYVNGYGEDRPTEIPPGWDDWHGTVDPSTYFYYRTTFNDNGKLTTYGTKPADYSVDVASRKADRAIRTAATKKKPFFLNLAPIAPHTQEAEDARVEGTPAVPAPRHQDEYASASLPRLPNFDELDISDKPATLAQFFPKQLTEGQIADLTQHYRGRMGSLLSVNDMVGKLVKTLKATKQDKNTVVIFTSDNGWILGEHRINDPVTSTGMAAGGKWVPFEGSSRVPLYMAGPGVPKGKRIPGVVTNADVTSTIVALGRARPTHPLDGRSLLPALRKPSVLDRRGVLIEAMTNPRNLPKYESVRTERYRYDLQDDGAEGLFDLKKDPYELTSFHGDTRYAKIKTILRTYLLKLKGCKGETCQTPVPKLPEPGA